MRFWQRGLLMLMTAAVLVMGQTDCQAAKKFVAVMPLEKTYMLSDSSIREEAVSQIMADQLVVAVQESGNYSVVERTQFDKIFKELGFQNTFEEHEDMLGDAIGADYLLLGKITMVKTKAADKSTFVKRIAAKFDTPYRTSIATELRMVECKSGKVMLAKTVEGDRGGKDANDSLYNACKDVAERFMRDVQAQNPFTGRVIEVKDKEIYIDQGTASGLHKGETLLVAREDRPLEANGKIVGMTQTNLGRAKVVDVQADYAICRLLEGEGLVQKGDIVKRCN